MLRQCLLSCSTLLEPLAWRGATSLTLTARGFSSQSDKGSGHDEKQPDQQGAQAGQQGPSQPVNADQPPAPPQATTLAQQEAVTASVARSLMSHFDTSESATQPPAATAPSAPTAPPRPGIKGPDLNQLPIPSGEPEPLPLDVLQVVLRAVENCKPSFKVWQNKSGNRVTYVPRMVASKEQTSLAIRWILQAAHKRKESISGGRRPSMAECLATELLLAAQKEGSARQKRDEMHKLAVENRNNILRRQ